MSRVHPGTVVAVLLLLAPALAPAQDVPPDLLEQAARATGLTPQELQRRYQQQAAQAHDAPATAEPGRQAPVAAPAPPAGRGEDSYWVEKPPVRLPGAPRPGEELSVAAAESALVELDGHAGLEVFGRSFFAQAGEMFTPPAFGPVPASYEIGLGDEIVVDVWGDVEFRESRLVERDGSIILPKGGKIPVHGRTLAAVEADVREHLARSYAGLADGSIQLDVTLGALRTIRVFVIGDAARPGAYDLPATATVFTALYACGGPGEDGSLRDVRLVREDRTVAALDLYRFLLEGVRAGDEALRDGDTVFLPPRARTVLLQGAVRRPAFYELLPGESVPDLLRFGGGFTPQAASGRVHVERIVPPQRRAPGAPDRTFVDVALDPGTGAVADAGLDLLLDGDVVTVDEIQDRLWGWVAAHGHVKQPGRYEFTPGMTVTDLVARAGGAWPDALADVAVLDRIDPLENPTTIPLPLAAILAGRAPDVPLRERDELRVFARDALLDDELVSAGGLVRRPGDVAYRRGMTLRDLLARAGGTPAEADLSRVEVHRLRRENVLDPSPTRPAGAAVDVLVFDLRPDWTAAAAEVLLEPWDRLVVRRLPWYERQRNVAVQGEVLYTGTFALLAKDETLSSVLARAGGLKDTAYPPGARIQREGVGNVAIDLAAALAAPGSPHDVQLEAGDTIIVPERQFTVTVLGEVGFSTSLVHEAGRKIDWYVERAGGYLENADKKRTRVVHPNGLSLANRGGHEVLPGSTIVVPIKPPHEGPTALESLKDVATILASVATVWLVVDQATE